MSDRAAELRRDAVHAGSRPGRIKGFTLLVAYERDGEEEWTWEKWESTMPGGRFAFLGAQLSSMLGAEIIAYVDAEEETET